MSTEERIPGQTDEAGPAVTEQPKRSGTGGSEPAKVKGHDSLAMEQLAKTDKIVVQQKSGATEKFCCCCDYEGKLKVRVMIISWSSRGMFFFLLHQIPSKSGLDLEFLVRRSLAGCEKEIGLWKPIRYSVDRQRTFRLFPKNGPR